MFTKMFSVIRGALMRKSSKYYLDKINDFSLNLDFDVALGNIKMRCDAATDGPWEFRSRLEFDFHDIKHDKGLLKCLIEQDSLFRLGDTAGYIGAYFPEPYKPFDERGDMLNTDAWFIAHARTDVPMLLEIIERLMAEIQMSTDKDFVKHCKEKTLNIINKYEENKVIVDEQSD